MPSPGEQKTVQARILEYAEAIGWTIVSREEAERRRGFEPPSPSGLRRSGPEGESRAKSVSLFFDDLLDAKVREFNPRYTKAEVALLRQFRHLHTDIYGNPPSPRLRRDKPGIRRAPAQPGPVFRPPGEARARPAARPLTHPPSRTDDREDPRSQRPSPDSKCLIRRNSVSA